MTRQQIERFFRIFSKQLGEPVRVILTGAAAGSLLGHVRASVDVDFGIQPRRRDRAVWTRIDAAVVQTIRRTGIQVNYAQDIDRWSSITLLDYRRHTLPYKRFGSLELRLMDPAYWAIGKLGRYLELDRGDLTAVLRHRRLPPGPLIALWAKALRQSPPSLALTDFRRHVEDFLLSSGPSIWGARFDPERAIQQFRRAIARQAAARASQARPPRPNTPARRPA